MAMTTPATTEFTRRMPGGERGVEGDLHDQQRGQGRGERRGFGTQPQRDDVGDRRRRRRPQRLDDHGFRRRFPQLCTCHGPRTTYVSHPWPFPFSQAYRTCRLRNVTVRKGA